LRLGLFSAIVAFVLVFYFHHKKSDEEMVSESSESVGPSQIKNGIAVVNPRKNIESVETHAQPLLGRNTAAQDTDTQMTTPTNKMDATKSQIVQDQASVPILKNVVVVSKYFQKAEMSFKDYRKMKPEPAIDPKLEKILANRPITVFQGRDGEVSVPFKNLQMSCPSKVTFANAVAMYVDETGEITEVISVGADPHGGVPQGIYQCKFSPYLVNGVAVPFTTENMSSAKELGIGQ